METGRQMEATAVTAQLEACEYISLVREQKESESNESIWSDSLSVPSPWTSIRTKTQLRLQRLLNHVVQGMIFQTSENKNPLITKI